MQNPAIQSLLPGLRGQRDMIHAVLGCGFTPAQAVHQLLPSRTHVAWTIGHLAWSYDSALGMALGIPPTLPARHAELFAWGTKPVPDVAVYPSTKDLLASYTAASDRLFAELEKLPDSILSQPLPDKHPLKPMLGTIGGLIGVTGFHVGYHLGQAVLLLRAQGVPAGVGM
jgi:hypothetical protein